MKSTKLSESILPKNAPKKTEAIMRTVLDTIPASIFLKDTSGKYLLVNNAMSEIFGMSGSNMLGKTDLELAQRVNEKSLEAQKRMANDKEVVDCKQLQFIREESFIMPNGSKRWFQTTRKPLVVDGSPVAVMGVSVDITDRKKAESQLLVYHEKLRSLASELANIEDRERRRIAAELHDRIGQNLAVAKLKLEILTSHFSPGDYGKDHEEVLQLIDQTLNDTYSLTFEISPPILYELGLSPALEWLGEKFQKQHNIEFVFEDDEKPMPINDDLLGPIYRAVRELLINVAKHARAKKVKVVISNTGNNLKLTVIDDGIGFNPDTNIKADGHGGFGLFSIKERLNHLGGKLVIKSKPGKGSDFTLVVPIRDINENKPEKINEY